MAIIYPGKEYNGPMYLAADGERPMSNRYTTHAEAKSALRRHLAEYAREGLRPTGNERVLKILPAWSGGGFKVMS